MKTLTYHRDIFSANTIQEAKNIILQPERDATVEERWARETPVMTELIGQTFGIDQHIHILDYGCGIGRLSKELIDHYGCTVLGTDISADMQALATEYVKSNRFSVCFPEELEQKKDNGIYADFAMSIYVLQHCLRPANDIMRIHNYLKPGGRLLVLNNMQRCVPTNQGWVNDGKDIRMMLRSTFNEIDAINLPEDAFGNELVNRTFCRIYQKAE